MGGMLALTAFGIFVLPVIVTPGSDVSWANKVLLVLVLVSGIAAVSEHRRIATLLTVLAVAVVVAHLLDRVLPTVDLAAWHDILLIAALIVLATAVGINVFGSRRSIGDRLFGAIALYLLLGVIWASAYALVAATVPNAFAGAVPAHATMFEWGYFSLVTLTTVGYGDVTPVPTSRDRSRRSRRSSASSTRRSSSPGWSPRRVPRPDRSAAVEVSRQLSQRPSEQQQTARGDPAAGHSPRDAHPACLPGSRQPRRQAMHDHEHREGDADDPARARTGLRHRAAVRITEHDTKYRSDRSRRTRCERGSAATRPPMTSSGSHASESARPATRRAGRPASNHAMGTQESRAVHARCRLQAGQCRPARSREAGSSGVSAKWVMPS